MTSARDLVTGNEAGLDNRDFSARKSANLMLWVIAGFFAAFFIWAALTKLERTVYGMGRVVPSSKMQVVSNLEGGVIQEILVKPGQVVRAGDVLIRLSPTQSTSDYGTYAVTADALQAKIARLNAEVRGTAPNFAGVSGGAVATEQALYRARQAEHSSLISASNARANQAERAVAEAQSVLAARRTMLASAEQELAMIRPLAGRQIVSQMDFLKAESAVKVARSEVTAAEAGVARSQAAVAEARAAMAQARSDWLSRAGGELAAAQAELAARRSALPALADKVDRTSIRAPMSGRVNRVLVTTVGGTVTSGMPIAEIVPSEEVLYIDTAIMPQDIANIRLKQRAKVEITAYRSSIYGKLDGEVMTISPDVVVNEKTGESFYTVEVRTTSRLFGKDGKPLPIGPGMMANVSLLGEERSVLSYIFSPFTQLKENAFRE